MFRPSGTILLFQFLMGCLRFGLLCHLGKSFVFFRGAQSPSWANLEKSPILFLLKSLQTFSSWKENQMGFTFFGSLHIRKTMINISMKNNIMDHSLHLITPGSKTTTLERSVREELHQLTMGQCLKHWYQSTFIISAKLLGSARNCCSLTYWKWC